MTDFLNALERGVRESDIRGKTYIFIKTWNKTHALKFNSKVLTDEIIDQIETKTGVPKKQQRNTHQSKQRTTQQTLNRHNIQENDTIDQLLELKGETGTADPTEQSATDTDESAVHNDAQTIERKPIIRRASAVGVDLPESADVDTTVEQLEHDMERLAKQKHDSFAATLRATLSTMRQESNARFTRVEAKIIGNTNAFEAMQTRIDARIDAPENNSRSGSHKGNEQNSVRAVATGFTESSTERKSERNLKKNWSKNMRWRKALKIHIVQQNRPQIPIKKFKTEKDRNGFVRLTSRQHYTIEQRTIRFKPDLYPEESYLQKAYEICEILPQHNFRNTVE